MLGQKDGIDDELLAANSLEGIEHVLGQPVGPFGGDDALAHVRLLVDHGDEKLGSILKEGFAEGDLADELVNFIFEHHKISAFFRH